MKFSEQWLREWVNPPVDTVELAAQLTMAGLEVDAVEPVAGRFTDVIVAEIVACEQHPDADKLRVCTVSTGDQTVQIVCGAPNARAGLKAPLARVGAVLPGDLKIRGAKLRGVESQGMLCAESELGISTASAGLMELPVDAPVGTALADYLGLDDHALELGLTPNRADCLGIIGIAREVALLNDMPFTPLPMPEVAPVHQAVLPVRLAAPARCPRYLGRVVRGIDNRRPSPLWLTERLRRSGVRSIDAVVDVTNYVLLELGQPLHAFDLARLEGGITVREAAPGESMTLLDASTIKLDADMLVIADDAGPVALAGIMGGADSAVSEETTSIFLESAFFAPLGMAGKARRLGMHTDASHRYERGVDYQLQRRAIERATELLLRVCGGEPGPVIEAVAAEHLPQPAAITLRTERIQRLLGLELPAAEVERIFAGLALGPECTVDGWQVRAPSWRFDLAIEADLIEELARIHGYDRLPVTRIRADLVMPARPEARLPLREIRRLLIARGYTEAITYSFTEPALQAAFDPELAPVTLANPISSELAVMRTSLLPGLITALQHNLKRQVARVRLFESGLRFLPAETGLEQRPTLAAVLTGSRWPEAWGNTAAHVDFFDLKGDLEALFELTGSPGDFRFERDERAGLHPGRTATIWRNEHRLGVIGAIHPELARRLDLRAEVIVCELDLAVLDGRRLPAAKGYSRYPEVRRDLALVVAADTPAEALLATVRAHAGVALQSVKVFDVYAGDGVASGHKSIALGLQFRDTERTLDDAVVSRAVAEVVAALEAVHAATLRR